MGRSCDVKHKRPESKEISGAYNRVPACVSLLGACEFLSLPWVSRLDVSNKEINLYTKSHPIFLIGRDSQS